MRKSPITRLLAVLIAVFCALPAFADETERYPMPDFTLRDQYGEVHTLADYAGRVILLNFWTTWCPWCIREMPDLETLYHELGENAGDVVILGVANPSGQDTANQAEVIAFLAEKGFTYPCLMDTEGKLFSQMIDSGYPTTWMVRADGSLMGYVEGAMSRDGFLDIIRQTRIASGLEEAE